MINLKNTFDSLNLCVYIFISIINSKILQQIFNEVETYIYSYTHIILENIKKKKKNNNER